AIAHPTNIEAINHLTPALELLKALPDTPARIKQELPLQLALSVPLTATKGWAAVETESAYTRAWALCQQLGETPQLFPVLIGLRRLYAVRGELQGADEMAGQRLKLPQR